jgi:hypothetical protein
MPKNDTQLGQRMALEPEKNSGRIEERKIEASRLFASHSLLSAENDVFMERLPKVRSPPYGDRIACRGPFLA